MRSSALFALAGASVALAQSDSNSPLALGQSLLNELSPTCRSTVIQLATNSSISQCLHLPALLPVVTTNGSIIPPLDNFMEVICSSNPCSNEMLNSTAAAIVQGCSTDLDNAGIDDEYIYTIVELYPLGREILCLKTSEPFNSTNATIPITDPPYNTTNGTFCVTSLLTEVSAYLGENLTISSVAEIALGGNETAYEKLSNIPPTALCQDCIFAAIDLVEVEYPEFGNLTVGKNNRTLNEYLDKHCEAEGFDVTNNGTLPNTITETAFNTTFPFNVTANGTVIPAGNGSVPPPEIGESVPMAEPTATMAKRDVTAAKRRWIGQ